MSLVLQIKNFHYQVYIFPLTHPSVFWFAIKYPLIFDQSLLSLPASEVTLGPNLLDCYKSVVILFDSSYRTIKECPKSQVCGVQLVLFWMDKNCRTSLLLRNEFNRNYPWPCTAVRCTVSSLCSYYYCKYSFSSILPLCQCLRHFCGASGPNYFR